MTERQPTVLEDHQPRSETTVHGWPAVFLGLPFLAAGIAILLVAADVIEMSDNRFNAPRWVVGFIGAMFALCGAWLSLHGATGLRRRARTGGLRSFHPQRPWLSDHPWNRRGIRDDTVRESIRRFFATGVFAAFLVPFNWWAFASGKGGLFVVAIVLVFDGITLLIFGHAIYLTARRVKYGPAHLRFERFPYFLGDDMTAWLARPAHLDGRPLAATLRCVEERYERRGPDGERRQAIVGYLLYEDSQEIDVSSYSRDLAISFPLPADGAPTRLGERPPCYWELVLAAEQPGVDYAATFLLPVYARPPRADGSRIPLHKVG